MMTNERLNECELRSIFSGFGPSGSDRIYTAEEMLPILRVDLRECVAEIRRLRAVEKGARAIIEAVGCTCEFPIHRCDRCRWLAENPEAKRCGIVGGR